MSSSCSTSSTTAAPVPLLPMSIADRKRQQESFWFITGPALVSGAVQAVFFNPIDRALYLRVHHRRSFFDPQNWTTPFQGFANAAVYRTVCSASYLMWQDTAKRELMIYCPSLMQDHRVGCQLLIGVCAGTINGFLLNQLQIVKYRMWSDGEGTFLSVSRRMVGDGGPMIFFRGIGISVGRDAVFGTCYEVLRAPHIAQLYGEGCQFSVNVVAACIASCLSSPFNYCRNVIYGAPPNGCPLSTKMLLSLLLREARKESTLHGQFRYLNTRLNIGWGSLRVGLGMGIGQFFFKVAKDVLHKKADSHFHSAPSRR